MASSPLVTPSHLAGRLKEGGTTVLDIRSSVDGGGRAAYEAGHIPGAVHTDYVADGWRTQNGAAAGALPDEAALAALFSRLGLTPDTAVVVAPAGTSSGDFAAAARVYWTLKVACHDRVSLLDGGTAAWVGERRPVETGAGRRPTPTAYRVKLDPSLRATADNVAETLAGRSDAALVDSRGHRFFTGEEKSGQVARAGRLPGAVLVDGAQAYDAGTNRLKRRTELDAVFAAVPENAPAIPYCNTGHAAATDWFVLSEIMGRPGIRLYDGSMSDWTADPGRAVATGEP